LTTEHDDALEAAQDAGTSPSRLAILAFHEDPRVQEAVAGNPSTPLPLLWDLGGRFPGALAANPLLPVLALAEPGALSEIPAETFRALLGEPSTPPWLAAFAVRNSGLSIQDCVQLVRSPGATATALLAFVEAGGATIRAVLADLPSLAPEVEAALCVDSSDGIRVRMALRPGLSRTGVEALERDSSPVVRLAVRAARSGASSPGVPRSLPYGVATDLGDRSWNEDASVVASVPGGLLALVADGMGGGSSGDVAARIAVEAVPRILEALLPATPAADRGLALQAAIVEANLAICEASTTPARTGIGTTVAAVLLDRQRAFLAHVGDSRVYRLRAGTVEALTRDHSLLHEYLAVMPDLSETQIAELPRNVITRALGMSAQELKVDLREEEVQPGDIFAVCTDGAFREVPEDVLRSAMELALDDPARAARALVDAGLRSYRASNTYADNATAAVVVVKS
jgi:protein phosphatase